jgi:hypothetical protein
MLQDSNGNTPIQVPTIFNAKSQYCQGNCTIVIRPSDDVNSKIGKLPVNGGKICFTSGTFHLKKPIRFTKRNNILIHGAGASTQIRISNSETAFLFEDCRKIEIKYLSMQSLSPSKGKTPNVPKTRGVATFLRCSEVKISDCLFSCTQKLAKSQSCVTFYSKASSPTSQVKIQDCKFFVGSMQVGVLIVNVDDVTVRNNLVDALPILTTLSRYVPKSTLFRHIDYRNLVRILCESAQKIRVPIRVLRAAINTGNSYIHLLNHALKCYENKDNRRAASSLRKAEKNFTEIDLLLKTIKKNGYSSYSESIGQLKSEKLIPLIKGADEPTDKISDIQTVLRDSSKIFKHLEREFSSINEKLKPVAARKELDKNRAIVYSAVTMFKNPKFNVDMIKKVLELRNYLQVGYQAIVIGGSGGKNLRIYNNTIRNMIQGIHVGASVKDPKGKNTKHMEEVSVCSNNIDLANLRWLSRQKHGIFVGNTEIAIIKDNVVSLDNKYGVKSKIPSSPVNGICLFGYHGKMILVSSNVISDVDNGIYFRTLGFLHSPKPLRIMTCNVVFNTPNAYIYKQSYDEATIEFADENNVPSFSG